VFELGKDLLDGVEIGTVWRQEEELGADAADGLANGPSLVAAEIVHNHNVASLQAGQKEFPDIGEEFHAVDRPIKDARGINPVAAQCGEERLGSPAAMRRLADQALSASAPASQRRHIRLGPGLIDEDEPRGIDFRLVFFPLRAAPGDVGPVLLACDRGFF
jgi:hypothetical protein